MFKKDTIVKVRTDQRNLKVGNECRVLSSNESFSTITRMSDGLIQSIATSHIEEISFVDRWEDKREE